MLLVPCSARAVDTLEPFGVGASDFELYVGGQGLGATETELWTTLQLGYGLAERLSAYLTGTVMSDPFLRSRDKALGLGLYGDLLDNRLLDLDILLEFRLSGGALSTVAVAPGAEANLDIGRFDLFLRVWEVLSGRERTNSAAAGASRAERGERTLDTELCLGAYWTVRDGQQLLVCLHSSLHHTPERGEPSAEVGGVALGYNVMVHDGIELINEVRLDIPQANQTLALGAAMGILVSF